ncbi:MAG TPA: hypothetical protein VGF69_05185 [Thermoanaerobaculia bacterium]
MTRTNYARLTLILSCVAAALALSAAAVRYYQRGEVLWPMIAAAIFILAFGLGASNRMKA